MDFPFTKLIVGDLDRMAQFYSDVFSLKQVQRLQVDADGTALDEIIFEAGGGGRLILMNWITPTPVVAGEVILGFTTTDVSALFSHAIQAGASVRLSPRSVEQAGGLRTGILEDPEGHLIEVVEVPA